MADMYGAVRSNWFVVKDPDAFRQFFEEKCRFGEEIELFNYDSEPNLFAFGGYEQYPSAYPMMPYDEELGDTQAWNLDEFADAIRTHLADDQEFRVFAAGNEKLRYVAATHLIVTHKKVEFNDYYEGN